MTNKFSLWAGVALIVVILLAAWSFVRYRSDVEDMDYDAVYEPAPEAVSVTDQAADMTDLEAELTTLDANFDSDLDQLDKELQGI